MKYNRRAGSAHKSESEPTQDMDFLLEDISIRFAQLQYQSVRKLLETFDAYQARSPYFQWRPKCRPGTGTREALLISNGSIVLVLYAQTYIL